MASAQALLILLVLGKLHLALSGAVQKYPKSCQESYQWGNTQSGQRLLEPSYGDVFEVFCYFVDQESGFVFPSRAAVDRIYSFDIADLSSNENEVLILEKHNNGVTKEALVKPLPRLTHYGLTYLHNEWASFAAPLRRNKFGGKFLYLGVLDIVGYQHNRQHQLGFVSNGQSISYSDCDGNPNNYFVFYANQNNAAFCETGWPMGQSFLDSFRSSRCPQVMQNADYWFTLEMHFGGCGMRYANSGCYGRNGYAIGLPFKIGKPIGHPENCKESYDRGNQISGKRLLQTSAGDEFEVYCYFVNRKSGFVFPSRAAVDEIDSLDIAKLSNENEVLILEKHNNGVTKEALVKPLPRLTRNGLTSLHNEWASFAAPLRRNKFGGKFLYLGVLDIVGYQQNRQHQLGFVSNGQSITYSDCDRNPNNYFVFYANPNNAAFCETGWSMGRSFLNSFSSSRSPDVMQSPDYWFTLEMHFGGCGMRYANSGCYGRNGYAIGLPFNL